MTKFIFVIFLAANLIQLSGCSALHSAAVKNDLVEVRSLISKGADVNSKDVAGDTPLIKTAWKGHAEMSKWLIENGADVNTISNNGSTPLLLAADGGYSDIAKMLIEKGANLNVADKNGDTPLHRAAWMEHAKIAKMLVENGANVNVLSLNGTTPLLCAVEKNNADIAKMLLENGADISIRNSDGRSPIERARQLNNIEVYNLLNSQKESFNKVNLEANTAVKKTVIAPTERLVLMPIRVGDGDQSLQGAMETALVQGLQQKYVVFSGERVASVARKIFNKESRTAKRECDETRCLEDIAIAFQAELIAIVNVTKKDGGYFLALSVQNIFNNQVVYSNSVPCEGCNSFQVVSKLKELGAQ